jgi:hypothetical protein
MRSLLVACLLAAACAPSSSQSDGSHASDGGDAAADGVAPLPDSASNAPPVAHAGGDQLAAVGLSVRFDGRGSSDPDGDPLTFRWSWKQRPAGSTAPLLDDALDRPQFVPDVAGEYVATLTVDDGALDSAPDDAVVTVRATGRFVPHFVGSGELLDLSTGDLFSLPQEQRIHLWVLPEGYLASELPAYESDVAKWWQDLLAIDVYAEFKQAFVVWKLPVASAEHVSMTTPQAADTAFKVPFKSTGSVDGSATPDGPTADRVWSYMAEFPFPAAEFYGQGGVTNLQAKGIVASVLVLDPATGKSGYSGVARRLPNPQTANQFLSVAFARNTSHEFTHALARLADEYIVVGSAFGGDATKMNQSAFISNVVTQPQCNSLPWQHLLDGSAINPATDGLVGAFGTASAGYHPELKCLMNGTHDNATVFGGDGYLRTTGRLCNFCREITAFRIYERARILPDPESSLQAWTQSHRAPFFERLGFHTPDVVPQQNNEGTAFYQACSP